MKNNVGRTDRTIRIVIGVLILAIGLFAESWWGLIGLIPVVTGMIGWCPLYVPFGISSARKDVQEFQPGSGVL